MSERITNHMIITFVTFCIMSIPSKPSATAVNHCEIRGNIMLLKNQLSWLGRFQSPTALTFSASKHLPVEAGRDLATPTLWVRLLPVPPYKNDISTLRPRQNGRHFAADISKCIFMYENFVISNKMSLKIVPFGPINNIPALVRIMDWHRIGDKRLSEPMLIRFTDAYMRH